MSCTHLVIYRSGNGHHYCGHCGVHVAVVDHDTEDGGRQHAIGVLVDAARVFAKVTRSRRKDLYAKAFQALDAAARALDVWYDDPVLPEPRARASRPPDR